METKKLKKLSLKKEIVSSLNNEELKNIKGGWTTSFQECTQGLQFLCCLPGDTGEPGSISFYF